MKCITAMVDRKFVLLVLMVIMLVKQSAAAPKSWRSCYINCFDGCLANSFASAGAMENCGPTCDGLCDREVNGKAEICILFWCWEMKTK